MKVKLHIGVLILILTVLGVASQQQIPVANQEIVLQFTDIEVTSAEAQNALSIVKNQLLDLGVDDIKIKKEESGKLRITYYSDVNVALVKETLSKEKRIQFNYASNKKEEGQEHSSDGEVINYDIIIYEIQNTHDTNLVFNGYVLETKSENDRVFEPNVFLPTRIIDVGEDDSIAKITFKIWRNVDHSRDNPSYIFPEVRAGPQLIKTS